MPLFIATFAEDTCHSHLKAPSIRLARKGVFELVPGGYRSLPFLLVIRAHGCRPLRCCKYASKGLRIYRFEPCFYWQLRILDKYWRPSLELRWCGLSIMAFPHMYAAAGPFYRLPIEIILQILASVPSETKACLALCNKELNSILGNKYISPLRKRNHRRRSSLVWTLDQDLADSFFCFHCKKLHLLRHHEQRPLLADELFLRVTNSRCSKVRRDAVRHNQQAAYVYHPRFTFEHLYMALKLHRRKADSEFLQEYLEHLRMSEPLCRAMVVSDGISTCEGFYFFEPRIIDNGMFVRAQCWFHIPRGECPVILMKGICQYDACVHQNFNVKMGDSLLEALKRGTHPPPHAFCQGSCYIQCRGAEYKQRFYCGYCPTSILLEVKHFDEAGLKGTAVVLTKWQYLGSGASPNDFWEGALRVDLDNMSSSLPLATLSPFGDSASSRKALTVTTLQDIYEQEPGTRYDSILSMEKALNLLEERSSFHPVGRRVASSRVLIEDDPFIEH